MTRTAAHLLLANRFEATEHVGTGGMGTVYRARDLHTNQWVALKFLNDERVHEVEIERFRREARLLAELRHPGIVGYVAHGQSSDGRPFLAMEWLEGEDLAKRLRRGPMRAREIMSLMRQVAAALAFAHKAGVVHRDLKPSNLFLRKGSIDSVAILDFGIARRTTSSIQMTRTGAILGTPDYMAPEQARGDHDVGPKADIFSLGCVVYECFAGRPPFTADHLAAVLAKILFASPDPLPRSGEPAPPALEDLVMLMLAKAPAQRPESAVDLLARLNDITLQEVGALSNAPPRASLAGDEQRLLCVLVATPLLPLGEARTMAPDEAHQQAIDVGTLRRAVAAHGAQLEALADGSLVVTLSPDLGGVAEQAAHAIQCAMLLRERLSHFAVALATGRGVMGGRLPVGEALDRAGQLLHAHLAEGRRPSSEQIVLDEVTAGLVGGRYQLRRDGSLYTLDGDVLLRDSSRPLLGRPTPCVSRETELGALEGAFLTCVDEGAPQAVLITGAPGLGKSRLRHEFLRRLEQRGHDAQVWIGGCDPLSAGTPYGPLSRALRQLCKVKEGESLAEKQRKLAARVGASLPASDAPAIAAFIGELCGAPFPDGHNIKLAAARQDPRVMSDQVTQALLRFLQAECASRPVVLVLEDMQWGDVLTTALIKTALAELRDARLLVVVTAWPEVHELFPKAWLGEVQLISLRPLSRKASERMVQQLLGGGASPETVNTIVERAAGNPLWLEELVRAAAEGNHDQTPQTVMAMLQARVSQLEGSSRQALRAASVFGETFWQDGVVALLGEDQRADVAQQIEMLLQRELLIAGGEGRYPRQRELRFRHTLMRDAAYSLLTDEDRALGHRLAGAFLESQGEGDSAILAEHARRGGEPERAVLYYSRAAEGALNRNDIHAALRYARASEACGPIGEARGLLRCIEATANLWGGALESARAAGLEALELLPRGGGRWFQAMHAMWLTTIYLGQPDLFRSLREQFRDVEPTPDAIGPYVEASSFLIVMSSLVGQAEESLFFLERLERLSAPVMEKDVAVRGWVKYARGVYCHWIENDLWLKARLARETIAAADLIGDRRMRCLALTSLGVAQMGLGAYSEGTATFREALSVVRTLQGEGYLLGSTTAFFACGLSEQRDPDLLAEVIELSTTSLAAVAATSPAAGLAHINLARAHALRGDLEAAEEHARQGVKALRVEPAVCPIAFAALAQTLLRRGDVDSAAAVCREGLEMLDAVGRCCTEVELLHTAAEVEHSKGDIEAARGHLIEAARRLRRSADLIPDADARRVYLTAVPLHAELCARVRAWVGEQAAEALLG